ncbi:hypothetical protein HMPREF1129_1841 [Actinomyces naeslundii str. Howell 279]|uniref:Uncharacterized protein n=1 Tax=Actinomyces naeslundii (strain ATCC 12104 / DSM 43013 / CCUG 2238 / JCM 8349 / NCTC 10301 / Howell 279) TaxID=1115803 RepID=J3AAZ2_ACTNH|nr:hypothetical protein HMPREF1129_1841 [Actinomyces naeslundii str. Howell 279]
MVPVFTSAAVAQRVVDSLKLDETAEEFASSVSATRVPETVSVQVSATAYSSHRAQVLADEVVRQASAEIKDLEGEDSPVEIVLLSSAELVSATRSPALVTCVAVGCWPGWSWAMSGSSFRSCSTRASGGRRRFVRRCRCRCSVPCLGFRRCGG